jgi:hypothetical protein
MLTRLALVAGLCVALAGEAVALTCLPLDLQRSYAWADEREEPFVIALGSLARTGPDTPDGPASDNPQGRASYSFPARFEGRLAGSDGFTAERVFDVTVEVQCRSAWCGGDSLSDYGLYFFRQDAEDAHALEAGLCGGFFFDNPTEHQLMDVLGMMR